MKILFDIGHPAHVHLFKNFINYLKIKGHTIFITSRDKEITNSLLQHYQFDFINLSKPKKGIFNMLIELIKRDIGIWKLHKQHKLDFAFGTSVSIGHLSILSNVKSFNFNEDDDDVVPLYAYLSYPFCSKIINPDCLRFKKWRSKRVLYNSYHEFAYLHPNNFTPDEKILEKYGLIKKKYIIFRSVALSAHHDKGARGINERLKNKLFELLNGYDIIHSSEGKSGGKIQPWDMHHVLAFAKMIISDSQTMTIEAAVMGVPAIRINTFIGKSSVIDELEHRFKLAFGYFPEQEEEILATVKRVLEKPDLEVEWSNRRNHLLVEKIDFNQWMIDFFEKEINKK
ncbi:MAG: DUF354 domain-containing protein [Chitinophagales bacterium]|nr:DUF354 domain-containing protein [Chitinophagales bacterium]MDW8273036.1 DUF354 domain-containing protein [Chitinophagales bacterium]